MCQTSRDSSGCRMSLRYPSCSAGATGPKQEKCPCGMQVPCWGASSHPLVPSPARRAGHSGMLASRYQSVAVVFCKQPVPCATAGLVLLFWKDTEGEYQQQTHRQPLPSGVALS